MSSNALLSRDANLKFTSCSAGPDNNSKVWIGGLPPDIKQEEMDQLLNGYPFAHRNIKIKYAFVVSLNVMSDC